MALNPPMLALDTALLARLCPATMVGWCLSFVSSQVKQAAWLLSCQKRKLTQRLTDGTLPPSVFCVHLHPLLSLMSLHLFWGTHISPCNWYLSVDKTNIFRFLEARTLVSPSLFLERSSGVAGAIWAVWTAVLTPPLPKMICFCSVSLGHLRTETPRQGQTPCIWLIIGNSSKS